MTVQTVVHCWNYSRLACLHLSQFVLHPPKNVSLLATVCYCEEDEETVKVLEFFGGITVPNVEWNWFKMSKERLCRRAIGRDEICRTTTADTVLLGDVDYAFTSGALDAIVAAMFEYKEPKLFYPRKPQQSVDHAAGDSEIAKVTSIAVYDLDHDKYHGVPLDRAIGGCQWIFGSTAREKGYLPAGHKFMQPAAEWQRTRCDPIARFHWGLPQVPLKVQGVTRIRHSTRGRTDIGCRN